MTHETNPKHRNSENSCNCAKESHVTTKIRARESSCWNLTCLLTTFVYIISTTWSHSKHLFSKRNSLQSTNQLVQKVNMGYFSLFIDFVGVKQQPKALKYLTTHWPATTKCHMARQPSWKLVLFLIDHQMMQQKIKFHFLSHDNQLKTFHNIHRPHLSCNQSLGLKYYLLAW